MIGSFYKAKTTRKQVFYGQADHKGGRGDIRIPWDFFSYSAETLVSPPNSIPRSPFQKRKNNPHYVVQGDHLIFHTFPVFIASP